MTSPDASSIEWYVLKDFLASTIGMGAWGFPAFVVLVVFIFFLVHQKWWNAFAIRHKWASRFGLFILTACLVVFFRMIVDWTFAFVPVQFAFESPNLTATAIKLGLYGLYVGNEEKHVLPGKEALLVCVDTVSQHEFENAKQSCRGDLGCIEAVHPMSREAIITEIMESQTKQIEKVSDACKGIVL
ncbi:MAG: hypothetical protein WCD70_06775 [Alphaproteobacteria bacterium]